MVMRNRMHTFFATVNRYDYRNLHNCAQRIVGYFVSLVRFCSSSTFRWENSSTWENVAASSAGTSAIISFSSSWCFAVASVTSFIKSACGTRLAFLNTKVICVIWSSPFSAVSRAKGIFPLSTSILLIRSCLFAKRR